MQNDRKVSVIIPTYNRAGYLKESLESALRQTYRNIEIIVVDDGSTDHTQELLKPYVDDGSIKYLYQKNSGSPSIARNFALRHASGEYICFLDSDDIRMEGSVARGVDILDRFEHVGMVCTDWLFFRRYFNVRKKLGSSWIKSTKYIDKLPGEYVKVRSMDFVIFEKSFMYELFSTNFVFTSSVLTRRDLLDQVGHFDESLKIGEDCDMWMRIGSVRNLAFVTEPQVYRRVHSGSITRDLGRNILYDTRVIEKFLQKKREMAPMIRRRFYRRLENFYFYTGYFFFMNKNLAESRKRFFRAIRYCPASFRNYRYFFLSLFPLKAVLFAKRMKRRMA
ncbi:MAG TPA: glycosyltransferase family 2 protein [Dissulfurispiraceae bacterium]